MRGIIQGGKNTAMCKAGKRENYHTGYGQESIMHGIWEGCMDGWKNDARLKVPYNGPMGKNAMGKVPWARCHVQGAMCKVVRQVHSTVVRLPDQTCLIRWPQVGPSDTAVRSPAAETASCLFKQAGSREET